MYFFLNIAALPNNLQWVFLYFLRRNFRSKEFWWQKVFKKVSTDHQSFVKVKSSFRKGPFCVALLTFLPLAGNGWEELSWKNNVSKLCYRTKKTNILRRISFKSFFIGQRLAVFQYFSMFNKTALHILRTQLP